MSKGKDLVAIIKANPGCVAVIDNDSWYLYKEDPYLASAGMNAEDEEAFNEKNTLASYEDIAPIGSGYGSGNCYGGDILQALAVIVGIKVQSV